MEEKNIEELVNIIKNTCGYEFTYHKPTYDLCNEIATAILSAGYIKKNDSGVLVIPCNPHSPLKGEECQKVVKVA